MRQSESTSDLYKALFAAQGEMPSLSKDGDNPHFRSKYITLDSLWLAVKPVLQKHGLFCTQPPVHFYTSDAVLANNTIGVTTRIVHAESGQWIESDLFLPLDKISPQAAGSALTYARRYSLASILGIVAESDDDAEKAMSRPTAAPLQEKAPVVRRTGTTTQEGESAEAYDNKSIGAVAARGYLERWTKMGIGDDTILSVVKAQFGGASINKLSNSQVLKLDSILVNQQKGSENAQL